VSSRNLENNMDKKIIIKKYENRRLYDTTHSRYVNLDEVARAVQDGCDVQVLDASTGEDLTRLVMTQIIIEGAKAPDSAFPLDILREMVVASGKATQESAFNYMRSVADMYKNALHGMAHPKSPLEVMQYMMNSASGAQADEVPPAPVPESASQPADAKSPDAKETELQELARRIQELESQVVKNSKASRPRKKVRSRANT
jgi:polyhydroxyalkanoate synthesis repressor PhaR